MRSYFVYLMMGNSNTLYTGVTNNLERRVYEHKHDLIRGFTRRYRLHHLVYFEETSDVNEAIAREKQIKGWTRKKKIDLINLMNPDWRDLGREWEM